MAQPPPTNPKAAAAEGDATDPSMDDILASIRRILHEEDKAAKPGEATDDVLKLDAAMMVDENGMAGGPDAAAERSPAPEPTRPTEVAPAPLHAQPLPTAQPPVRPAAEAQPLPGPMAVPATEAVTARTGEAAAPASARAGEATLVAPEAAALAASAVGNLMRTLVAERHASVHRGGPSIEDVVREEIRPLLKAWLDEHLPALVERLVRAEIERVVGRMAG